MKHSYSLLNVFLGCERRHFFERVLNRRSPDSIYTAVGSLYHEGFATLARGGTVDAKALVDSHCPLLNAVGCPTGPLVDEVEANLERVQREVLPLLRPTAVEVIRQAGGLYGKLDVVSGTTPIVDSRGRLTGSRAGGCVIDWKVVFSARRRPREAAERSAQLALYCLVASVSSACFVEVPRDIRLPLNTVVVDFSTDDLSWWSRYLQEQFTAIEMRGPDEAAYRLADPGNPLCSEQFCPHYKGCPGGSGKE